ncbi:MAG: hypothetical protein Q8Q12_21755 [bacterium]|nr:hypothetical protein [bacterium]
MNKAMRVLVIAWIIICISPTYPGYGEGSEKSERNAYARWQNGPPSDPGYFPIAVWLQEPRDAQRYKDAGFNLYVGLWRGPTEEQLAALKAAGMSVICHQNESGLRHKDDKIIVGWMHGDEPDNAQPLRDGKGYGPPIAPEKIVADYEKIREADPSRPVLLNLGQGVAWDAWHGRGVRTNHPEDYLEYIKGCDIASFDIYPVAHPNPAVQGKLWFVARGVERLTEWSKGGKIVWNCIECTRIQSGNKATPHQVKAEVWMSLIHGSTGLIYFVHEWKPNFNSHALLDDPEMLKTVTEINRQIHSLAAVLNSRTIRDGAKVKTTPDDSPIGFMVKRHAGETYLFAVATRDAEVKGLFELKGLPETATAEVLGEERSMAVGNGKFTDTFKGYDVRLYRIR